MCQNETELMYHPIYYKIRPCQIIYCNLGLICPNLHPREQKMFDYGEFFRFDINTHKTKPCMRRGIPILTKISMKGRPAFISTMNQIVEDQTSRITVMSYVRIISAATKIAVFHTTKLNKCTILVVTNQNFANPFWFLGTFANSNNFVLSLTTSQRSKSSWSTFPQETTSSTSKNTRRYGAQTPNHTTGQTAPTLTTCKISVVTH